MDPVLDHHEYCTGGFDSEDIVISGMAGRFPECDSVGELKEALFNKKDLIEFRGTRFEKGDCNAPYDSPGLIKNLDKLDTTYFRVNNFLANMMDPGARTLMEVSYEAIADAGYDASNLKGQKIGIFNATTQEDSIKINTADESFINLHGVRTMNPNRTTYVLDFTGPSYTVDSACSSSGVALWSAYQSIQNNTSDAAVVTGNQLNLHPVMLTGYAGAGIVTLTGNCRPFDANSDGMIRTESITALFLQKAKHARRIYATLPVIKFYSAGFLPEGINVPSAPMLKQIILDTLEEANVDRDEIEYVETHGTGTQVGDKIEANVLGQAFCKNRKRPLLIGTIKSNLGHTEASSAICGVIKSLLAFETNTIPPNIKYDTPNPNAPDLVEGRLKVVTEPTPLNSDYIPINCLGFGGTLVEMLLKRNPISTEKRERKTINIPRLILYPATTEEGINFVFEYIKNNPDLPDEFFALLHKLSFTEPLYKPYRGYAICQEGKSPVTEIKNVSPNKRQIWYIMTGMGCQWPGMGLEHMKIDVFAESMHKSAEILKPYGIDLFGILKGSSKDSHDDRNITASFVSICAIQIALVDLLKHLDVTPDGMVGHSTGELLCAYADGCLTHEQTLLSSYYRGQSVENANIPQGGMAAVGLSWSQAQKICPEGIYPACDNATDSVTISGEKVPLEKFVEKLKQDNIFVRLVNSHGYGFHCKHVHAAAPALRKAQEKLIPNPKPRSERWVSSSYVESEWDLPDCRMASAEYFVHNLMSSVRFNDAIQKIPPDAIVIEVGPHFLLQSILKRSVGTRASYFGLMKRNEENNVDFLMESLGKLYNEGVDPKIERLYPPVQFPVPRGIPSISDLIKWNHSQSFNVPKYTSKTSEFSMEFKFDKDDAYILDHKIDGRSLFPATGYIYLAWEALASKLQKNCQEMPVVIENFKIHRPTVITAQALTKFFVNVLDSSGRFEITEGRSIVASGKVFECKNLTFQESPPEYNSSDLSVSASDIYDELKRSGYEYGPCFKSLVESNIDGTAGLVQWRDQWIPFLDALLLFFGIITNEEGFYLPTGALSFKIDPNLLKSAVQSRDTSEIKEGNNTSQNLPVKFNKKTNTCRTIGVEIAKLIVEPAPNRRKNENPRFEEYAFVPYVSTYTPATESSLQLTKYFNACNIFMDKIGKTLKKDVKQYQFPVAIDDEFCLEEYIEEITENQHLLKVLKQAISNQNILKEKRKDWFLSYSRFAGRDMLNNSLLNEDSLRIMLEIISENTFRKLNVIEIIRNFPVTLIPAIELMQKYSHLKFKKSILIASKLDSFNQETLDEHSIQVQSEENLTAIASEKAQDVVISSFACGTVSDLENLIQTLISVVKSNGFILFFHKERANSAELFLSSLCGEELQVQSQGVLEEILKTKNLVVLSKISDPFGNSLYLLRSPSLVAPQKVLLITENNYNWVDKVKEELFEKKSGIVWLVSEDSTSNGIVGLVNCLKQEPGGDRIRSVFISRKKQENNLPPFSLENPFYQNLVTKNLIMNVWRNGSWGSFRHILLKKNLGQGNAVLGLEFSGREDGTGKRVCGFAPARAMATAILTEPAYCIDVPDNWTLEEAATVPIVYATCYYALIMRAQLQKGESILIHSGTGGIGIAAITLALSLNCEVFTTVGNDDKRKYLKKKFPQLKDENIGCSRNISFETMVMERTNGKGVDVILNSLADEKFTASIRCIAKNGRFVEIGKYDLALDREIGLKIFLENIAFHAVFLDQLFDSSPKTMEILSELMGLLKNGIKTGVVQPLDRTVLDRNSVEEAFRYMSKGIHVGKVLLKIREEEPNKRTIPKGLTIPAVPETQFYDNKVYIIVGGLGGFGMEVTKWIMRRGGKNIILTTRYGARTPYHHFCLKKWQKLGVNVQVSTLNVAIKSEAEKLLKEASRIGPVGGIFNSAVVLKDAFMDCQTEQDYVDVCAPKATATKYLDELTRKLCPSLDYFVCFSSISCGRGNAGQTNYGYANSVMERVCEDRRSAGLHGLAIQWGIIGEVGVVHRHMGEEAMIAGVMAQGVKSCLEALDAFCQQDCPVVSSYVTAEQTKKSVQGDAMAQIMKFMVFPEICKIFRHVLYEGALYTQEDMLIQNKIKGPFHVMGYSIGGNVAFEMALQNAKSPTSLKTISLLSGAEDLMNTLNNEESQEKDSEVVALCRFVEQFTSGSVPRLEDELTKVDNLEQRIRAVLNYLTKSSSETINKNEVSEAISNYLVKHNIITPYIPSARLSKDINIIENPTKLLANDVSMVKELFSQVCTQKVSVHRVHYPNLFSNEKEAEQLVKILETIV
ncbi:fatty acid synthase [Trichonephila inaurata madagascariensis]|uniref:Fatty acid synthase n=1 Tax=Trichonephila inaurata madagascariensis TaxID=2747483 RepID=A0A8X6JAJ7_9ARAC|nr:fatty acid synthase [Trichonephila inaurata madagascariensis]